MIVFQNTFFSKPTVSDIVTKPQIKLNSPILRKGIEFNFQLVYNTLDRIASENFPNLFTEHELLLFLIKDENDHLSYLSLLLINPDIFSQRESIFTRHTRANSLKRPANHIVEQLQSNQSMITEKTFVKKSKQSRYRGNPSQIPTLFVIAIAKTKKMKF